MRRARFVRLATGVLALLLLSGALLWNRARTGRRDAETPEPQTAAQEEASSPRNPPSGDPVSSVRSGAPGPEEGEVGPARASDAVGGAGRVPLATGGRVRGQVESADGAPIPSATVEARQAAPGDDPRGERRATTGADGEFQFDDLEPGPWLVRATAPPRVRSGWLEVAIESGAESEAIVLTLLDGLAIEGRVRDDAGEPLPGARVVVSAPAVDAEEWTVETEAGGRFRFDALPAVELTLDASLEGHLPAKVAGARAGDSGLEIVLRRAARIRGRVVDEGGEAVARFRVEAKRDPGTYAVEPPTAIDVEDPAGRFLLEGLLPGLYDLRASATASSGSPATARGTIQGVLAAAREEGAEVTVRLERPGALFGSVRTFEGAAVGGALVALAAEIRTGDLGENWYERGEDGATRVRTSESGAFLIPEVRPGTHRLLAHARGRGSASIAEVVVEPGESRGPVSIVLHPGGAIEGTVTAAGGEPAEGVSIVVLPGSEVGGPRNARWLHARTDGAGAYRIEDLAADVYRVVRVSPGAGGEPTPREMRTAVVREGETAVVDFGEAPVGASLAGTVFDAAGARLADRQVVAVDFSRTGAKIESSFTDAEGNYRIAGLSGGLHGIYVTRGLSLNSAFLETVLLPDLSVEVRRDLTLPGGAVEGRVRDARTGAPLPRARLSLLTDLGTGPAFLAGVGVADAEGAFRFDDLGPRHYRVSATADGYGQEVSDRFFLGDEETRGGIDLSLHPGGSLSLLVLEEAGSPVARAFVSFRDPTGNTVPIGAPAPWTDSEGRLRASGVKPGRYDLAALKDGTIVALGSIEVREGERTEAVLRGMAPGVAVEAPRLPAPR